MIGLPNQDASFGWPVKTRSVGDSSLGAQTAEQQHGFLPCGRAQRTSSGDVAGLLGE